MNPVFPQPLEIGDTIGIVAPAGIVDAGTLDRAVSRLNAHGFKTKTYRDVLARRGYLAGSDEERAAELNQAFGDKECRAIFPARGGYGCIRLLEYLDFELIKAHPKIFVGFSDNTVLHSALWTRTRLVTFHGPHPCDSYGRSAGPTLLTEQSLWGCLLREQLVELRTLSFDSMQAYSPGVAEGRIVGGNLALVCALLGTPYEVEFDDNILLLEDTNEPPYRVDRMLAQLKLAGALDRVAGIILGQFTECDPDAEQPGLDLEQVFSDYLGPLSCPIVTGFPSGHGESNVTLPLGVRMQLDAGQRIITLLETGLV